MGESFEPCDEVDAEGIEAAADEREEHPGRWVAGAWHYDDELPGKDEL